MKDNTKLAKSEKTAVRSLLRKHSTDEIAKIIIDNCGELSFVAEDLGVPTKALELAVASTPRLQDAVRLGRESMLDVAEHCLVNAMKMGDAGVAKFVLKNLGTRRGWQPDNPQTAVQVNISSEDKVKKVREIFGLPEDDQGKLEDMDQ